MASPAHQPRAEVVTFSTGMEDVVPDVVDNTNISDDEYAHKVDLSEL